MRAQANPGGIGHGWVKERFITPAPPMTTIWETVKIRFPDGHEEERRKSRIFVPSTISILFTRSDFFTQRSTRMHGERPVP